VADQLLGYGVRKDLYPGEDTFFRENPTVAGMASESGHIILNPYSGPEVDRDAVAQNEAFRLYLRDRKLKPDFPVTDAQKKSFAGTAYAKDENALRETIAARVYSNDPSAKATAEQKKWVRDLLGRRMLAE
jgi:hypothetical protein